MKSLFRLRLWLLIAALIVVAGGTIYGLFSAWRRVQRLEAKLTSSQIESFRLASQVQVALLNLNNSMLRFAMTGDPKQWEQFQSASQDLNDWIDQHDPSMNPRSPLTTDVERQLFQELNHVYDDYLAAAREVHEDARAGQFTPGEFAELNDFDIQARRISDLARQLANAHRLAEAAFLTNANASLSNLRGLLAAGMFILLALAGAVGWVIYRDMVAPLRVKLVRSESLLEKQEKLATLGTLSAGIAHEIRNPLTSLKARLYTLEKHIQGLPAARKDTEIISGEISRLERIVQDVLSFARPSEPKLETLSTDTLLREVQALVAPNLESRGVQLVVEFRPDLFVRADSSYLKQVLINLVRNGADAIECTGTVTMRARPERVQLGGRETPVVILEVTDTGKGIPAEVRERLFDPFFSTKETGTGLGLSIAARIVERHGGALRYQTRVGHGTTFGVVLPRENES